jgi:hypothetical protein
MTAMTTLDDAIDEIDDATSGFPAPKVITRQLYFPLGAVTAFLARQSNAT